MKKVPISMIVDDPTPVLSVYYTHHDPHFTDDGRPLLEYYSNDFLYKFCNIIEKYGMKGKFTLVPMPGNRGDIINGIDGVDPAEAKQWLDTVKARVVPNFSVVPEMLTHNKAVDLATGAILDENEKQWAAHQDRTTLTPYICLALSLLKQAGFDVNGVSSPWGFGSEVEAEYAASIAQAMYDVYGKKQSFVFMHGLQGKPNARPWVLYDDGDKQVVTIPNTSSEIFWRTIHDPDASEELVQRAADDLITADGKGGQLVRTLETGGYPVFLCHWQSLISNGLGTGLRILEEVGKRVQENLSDRVEWMRYDAIMDLVLANKENYKKPE